MAEIYAYQLLNGSSKWGRVLVLSDIMYTLSVGTTNAWKWESQQKSF
jgi:hypothetical protein